MASLPEFGVFSTHTMMLDHLGGNEGRDALVKRMAILFDKLVFFPIGLGPVGTPDALFTREKILQQWVGNDSEVLAELDRILLLDHELIDDIEEFYHKLMFTDHDDLWTGESSLAFIDFCTAYVDENYPKKSASERWDLYKMYIGYVNSDYRLCQIVNRDFDNCSVLITELHEKAVLETLSTKSATTPEQVSTVLGNLLSVDFGALPWPEVFALRKSGFANDYRSRVAEWVLAHSDSDTDQLTRSLESFVRESVFDLIGDTEPKPRETILSGIGGNLPSPIVVNPISMFSAARDAKKAHSLKSKYGWLYFIQRGHAAARRNVK